MAGLPTAEDVVEALASAGITLTLQGAAAPLATALDLWESATGWEPFVSSGTPAESTLYVPASGLHSVLGLGGGVLPGEDVTVTLAGTELVAATDYQLCPTSSARTGKPYTYLKLLKRVVDINSGALVVEGVWGYCADDAVPPLVIAAILAGACLEAAQPILQAETLAGRAPQKIEQGDVTIQYGSTSERTQAIESWKRTWSSAVGLYARNGVT